MKADKSLLNIAGLIALILGIVCCVTIIGAIAGIPMIIGGSKLKEMSEMSEDEIRKRKDTLLIWTIVFLFLCTISGILALIFYIAIESSNESTKTSSSNDRKYEDLEKLKKLYDDKVLSKEEYEEEKKKILSSN